jgi:hypothetical protein
MIYLFFAFKRSSCFYNNKMVQISFPKMKGFPPRHTQKKKKKVHLTWFITLTKIECAESNTGDLDNLETTTWDITLGLTGTTKTST